MMQKRYKILPVITGAVLLSFGVKAQNPIIQTIYTADPAPMIYKDTVFLYTGHDEDNSTYFTMKDWHIFSTTDMVNWTDRGVGLSLKDFSWVKKDAWAGQCIERNGKFYWYVPMNQANGKGMAIGVAVGSSPTGPFKDALGKLLVTTGWGDIDPTVFIDKDGQAYLYWGNPDLYYVKLNKDMISYDQQTGIVKVPLTKEGFKLRIIDAEHTFDWVKSIYGDETESYKGPGSNKYYWYVAAIDKNTGKKVIAVGESDRGVGPFQDKLGKPLVDSHCDTGNINPTVVFDDNRQLCLAWGTSKLWYVKLNKDMMSYDVSQGISPVPASEENLFRRQIKDAARNNGKRVSTYEEGPWFYRRKNMYYLMYPAGGVPEHIAYSMSAHATGPWIYKDTVMPMITHGGAFTNHPGVIDYKGNSYFFYHNGALPGGGGFDRSVCVEQFKYNPDGIIPRIPATKAGVLKSVSFLNPYIWQQAETIAWETGVETASSDVVGVYVTDINDESYIKVRDVDFAKGVQSFEANVASNAGNGRIEIHADSLSGALVGTLQVKNTGGDQSWELLSCTVKKLKGVHDIYFVFKGEGSSLFNFDKWVFKR